MAISASYFPVAASFFAANGNSNAPGTCMTSTSLLPAPARSKASTAAARRRSVIKLLKRLTTTPKRKAAALSAPSIFPGCNFSAIVIRLLHLPHLLPLFTLKLRRPLLQKRRRAFTLVLRRTHQSKQRGFQEKPLFLGHLDSSFDRFHGVFHREWRVGDNFLRHCLRRGQEFSWFVNTSHQAGTLRLFRGNHLAGKAKLMRNALPTEPGETLRYTESRNDAEFHLRLPEFCGPARNANRATKSQLAPPAKCKSINRANRRLAHRFKVVCNALAGNRKFFSVNRSALGQFADVGPCNKCFFACARQDQDTYGTIIPRVNKRLAQLIDSLIVQRIQHLRPVESDVSNPIFLFVQ